MMKNNRKKEMCDMLFKKRSTRAIVTGKRPRNTEGQAEQGTESAQAAGGWLPRLRGFFSFGYDWGILCGVVTLAAVFAALLVIFPRSSGGQEARIPEGQMVLAVEADGALAAQARPGDVARLYGPNGQPISELRYVQVYSVQAGALLLLVNGEQAAVLAGQEAPPRVGLVVHSDPERAAELLALQERICDPEISLVLQSAAVLAPGEILELEYQAGIDPGEAVLPDIQWTSGDPAVAVVEDGILTGVGVGQATVTAVCGGVEAVCAVTVEIPLEAIVLDRTEVVLAAGETAALTAAADPADATGFAVTWSVEDPEVATVSEDGTVTAVAVGTTTVTASCGEFSASCTVTVGVHAEISQLDKQAMSIAAGSSDILTPTVYPGSGVVDPWVWETSDPAIATVSEDGTVTGVAPGTATITFRCGQTSASCTVTITAAPVQ